MKRRRYRILIIGSGVAGLSAAIALRRAGHEVRVFERAPELMPLGAGLILWSNAVAALRALDLEPQMLEIGHRMIKLSVMTPNGNVLSSSDARLIGHRAGAPTLSVHRADLLGTLIEQLPAGTVRFGRKFTGYEVLSGVVIAKFEGGSEEIGDVLVGADGIWSTTRAEIHGQSEPRYSGYTAWRSVIQRAEQAIDRTPGSTETWGAGTRFGWVPLNDDRVYWFAVKASPPGQEVGPDGHKAELLRLFGEWHSPIPETIEASDEERILRHDIYDRPPSPNWGSGLVTLAGDAAHPTTPNTGQGAAMAIEDSLVLANCLNRYTTIEAALRSYEAERYPRTAMITNLSHRIGRMAQFENPFAVQARNLLMRVIPDRLSNAQVQRVVSWTPPDIEKIES